MSKAHTQTCSVASFLNVFGDMWTLLVIKEAFYGATRFSEFHRNTGAAKNLLSERLTNLVTQGILEQKDVGAKGTRMAYELTAKGRALGPVMVAMMQWSDNHIYQNEDTPIKLIDRDTLQPLPLMIPRSPDGKPLGWDSIVAIPGPGADDVTRKRIRESAIGAPNLTWSEDAN